MLVLSRKMQERIVIETPVGTLIIVPVRGNTNYVQIGIEGDKDIFKVMREELQNDKRTTV